MDFEEFKKLREQGEDAQEYYNEVITNLIADFCLGDNHGVETRFGKLWFTPDDILLLTKYTVIQTLNNVLDDIHTNILNKPTKPPKPKRTPIIQALRHEVFKRDGYRCTECGATNKEKMLHTDHIVPVSQGGTDEMDNLRTLCDDCNLSKSNRCW